ncbi:MAG: hypothetical protein ACYDBJ_20665 [Aggregatilineales bacterium]
MSDRPAEMKSAPQITLAHISSAIAEGLQSAIERQTKTSFSDKILRYGGRLDFTIEVIPATMQQGALSESLNLNRG